MLEIIWIYILKKNIKKDAEKEKDKIIRDIIKKWKRK